MTDPSAAGPLARVRILAVEQYGAGPFGTMYLADLGAEVIKVEDPNSGGDVSRYVPPGRDGTDSLFFEAFNRGKKSVLLDLKSAAGREVFQRLVATADAVLSNVRGDQADELGVTYRTLRQIKPSIVCVTLSGYGRSADDAARPGYDALIQAESGWAALTGAPGDPPTKSGLSLADYIAGLTAALGLIAALLEARATGRGRQVDTNLYDSALAMLTYPATWYLSGGHRTARHPMSAHPSIVPFQFFRTADGHVAIACAKDKFFRALVERIGLEGLAQDDRFADFERRNAHRDELLELLEARLVEETTQTWLSRLEGHVPIAPVRSLEEALRLEELSARGMLAEYHHATLGRVRSVGLPLAIDGFEPSYRPGPRLGEHTEALMTEVGLDPAAIGSLRAAGAFGSTASAGPVETEIASGPEARVEGVRS